MEAQHTPDITTGFIQMVEAYKVKPELEAKISNLEHHVDAQDQAIASYSDRVRELEARLASASADKERLTRERDDAMFRSLELEDKTKSVSDLVAKLETLVRPEPVAKVETAPEPSVASMDVEQRDVSQEAKKADWSDWPAHKDMVWDNEGNVESFPRPEYSGQGYTSHEGERGHPTSESSQDYGSGTSQDNAGSNAESNRPDPVASPDVARHENHGKPYHDKPWWVNDNDWRNQGGQGPHEGGSWQAPWERQA